MLLRVWESQQPSVQGVDQGNTRLDESTRPYMRSEFLDFWIAEKVVEQLAFDLKRPVTLDVDTSFKMDPGEARRMYVAKFTANGTAYALPVGDIFAEMSDPYGWPQSDEASYRIGVFEKEIKDGRERFAGAFTLVIAEEDKPLQHGRSLPLQWHPNRRVVAEVPQYKRADAPPGYHWVRDSPMGEDRLEPLPGPKRYNLTESQISQLTQAFARELRS